MLDVPALRTFLTVIDQGGFNAAAGITGRPQSTISMQIRRLEETVGAPILIRDRTRVRPTVHGETLAAYARRMVDLHDDALAALAPKQPHEQLRLGTPADYATTFLVDVIPSFIRTHPHVDLEVHCDLSQELVAKLDAGLLDAIVVTRRPDRPSRGPLLTREPVVWAAARDGNAQTRTPLPLAAFPEGCLFRTFAADAADQLDRPTRMVFTSPALSALQIAVAGDIVVAVLARSTVTPEMRILGPEDGFPPLPEVEIELVTGTDSNAVGQFREAVTKAMALR